jgi:4-diphosphocytidyl-2-C-methyl-D-erythritol kinase
MFETAFAKINLALHVRAREPDSYHRIETIFAFAEDGDRLDVAEGEGLSLKIVGPFADRLGLGGDNLVVRAAEALRRAFHPIRGAALTLDKRLPVAAGLGGGSADAAATLRLLARWWELPCSTPDLEEIGRSLGADVPACLRSTLARGEGRGDRLVTIADRSIGGTPLLLVNPGVPLATGAVFAAWDGVDRGALEAGDSMLAARDGRNDLEAPAVKLAPEISDVLDFLAGCDNSTLVRMSGSGSSCFALFANMEALDVAAARIALDHPDWWHLGTRIRGGKDD